MSCMQHASMHFTNRSKAFPILLPAPYAHPWPRLHTHISKLLHLESLPRFISKPSLATCLIPSAPYTRSFPLLEPPMLGSCSAQECKCTPTPSWEQANREHSAAPVLPVSSLFSAQVNSPPAASTMAAARTCVCSPTKAMSTVPVEGAASSRTTLPAEVRKQLEARTEAARGCQYTRDPSSRLGLRSCAWTRAQLMKPSPSPAANSSCRAQDEFECANGECISFSLTCDGVSHCKDKSDEKPSYCSKEPTPAPALLRPQPRTSSPRP